MKTETKIIDGETWTKVPAGYAVLPLWATESMFKRVGGVTMTARAAWAEMVKVALKEMEAAKPNDEAEVDRLSRLTWFDYERGRSGAAKKLGVRVSVLDKAVKKRREEIHIQELRARMAAKYPPNPNGPRAA